MKVLSLLQPWASFVALGYKEWETRGWSTPYRGPLAIHASKTNQKHAGWFRDLLVQARVPLPDPVPTPDDLPFGKILCVVQLHGCVPTKLVKGSGYVPEKEYSLGDFGIGRYGWELRKLRRVEPLEYSGTQGLRDLELDVEKQLVYLDGQPPPR